MANILNKDVQSAIMSTLFLTPTSFAPSHLYLGLTTALKESSWATFDVSNFSEPLAARNYSRQQVDPGSANWQKTYNVLSGVTTVSNVNTITFPIVQVEDWGYITGWVLFDAATNGNPICFGLWDVPQQMNVTMTMTIDPNSIRILLS